MDRPTQLVSGDKSPDFEKKNLTPFESTSTDTIISAADKVIASDGGSYMKEIGVPSYEEPAGAFAADDGQILSSFEDTITSSTTDYAGSDIANGAAGSGQDTADDNNAANLFEQRQRQYLVGRKATKTIVDNFGSVIVNEGTVINDEIIDSAKASGKLVELVMNNKP